MKIIYSLGLSVLVISAWFLKFPLDIHITSFICPKVGNYCRIFSKTYDFITIFLIPFVLSIWFWLLFKKYKERYRVFIQWILKVIIILAIIFSSHSFFWVCPASRDFVPTLGGLFGVLMFYEIIISVSLILLLISSFVFVFNKKII